MARIPSPTSEPSIPPGLHVLRTGFAIGLVTFSIGFFGPLLWAPDANQGPLLGIFITGPIGFLVGLGIGLAQVILDPDWASRPFLGIGAGRSRATSAASAPQTPRAPLRMPSIDDLIGEPVVRILLGLFAINLLAEGALGIVRDPGRGPASAIVLGSIAGILATLGRIPSWLRRRGPPRS